MSERSVYRACERVKGSGIARTKFNQCTVSLLVLFYFERENMDYWKFDAHADNISWEVYRPSVGGNCVLGRRRSGEKVHSAVFTFVDDAAAAGVAATCDAQNHENPRIKSIRTCIRAGVGGEIDGFRVQRHLYAINQP